MKTIATTFFAVIYTYFFTLSSLIAQPKNLHFEHLSEIHGLSNNFVKSILQDQEGFMWFGTRDGLNKFDGYNFTVFRPDPNHPEHTLHHSSISDIHEDREGRLWITTWEGGFHQVDKHTGKVTHYEVKSSNMSFRNAIHAIYEDQKGMLWIAAVGGIARFDPATQQFSLYFSPDEKIWFTTVVEDAAHRLWASCENGVYQLDQHTGKFTPMVLDSSLALQPSCNLVYLDKEGILWAGTRGEGLFRLDTRQTSLRFTRYNPGGLISKNVGIDNNGFYEDDQGYIWVCSSEGLYRIDKRTDQVLNIQADPLKPGSLSQNLTFVVYQDQTGSLWIGTANGINKLTSHPKKFHTYQVVPASPSVSLDVNNIGSLVEDHTGKILMGSGGDSFFKSSHKGLYQFDPKTRKIKDFPVRPLDPDSSVSSQVWSLYEDQKKQLYVGTKEALHLLDSTTGEFIRYPSDIPVEQIVEDPSGKLWIGKGSCTVNTSTFGIASFDPKEGQFKYYNYDRSAVNDLIYLTVNDILASRTGDIWMAFLGGLARLNQQTETFTTYLSNSDNPAGHLSHKYVITLYEDLNGIIWVGTEGGLNRFDPETHTFTSFTMQDGLPSNHIVSIIGDESGHLWLGTTKGLSRFNPNTKEVRNYDTSDGLPTNEFRVGSVDKLNGKLMFGSVNGFVIFDPDSIQGNTTEPPVYITGFNVMEKNREVPTDKIALSYDENFLSFDFVVLNYDASEKNQYAYMLEGVDKEWVYSGNRRYASYTNLDPGEYVFRVKGSNNDDIWNEEGASIQFVILPPWWQTGWAYTLYGLLALGVLWSIRRYEIKRIKLRQRAIHLAEVDTLKTRFFANISHEFRTPLTLILGPLKDMYEGTFTGDRKAVFGVMIRNGQRLLNLINQLLDISKLEAGKMQLQATPTDLVALLRHITSSYESIAVDKQIKYFFYPEMQELMMYIDQEKIKKIVHNLLSNAFKFTPESGDVILYLKTQEKQWALISVKDTGTGIPEEELDKVFDRFYQVDGSHTRTHEGSGLGMALAKELVEMHQGRITVESKEGKGTTFTVWLPLGKAHLRSEEIYDSGDVAPHQSIPIDQPEGLKVAEMEDQVTPVTETNSPLILVVEDNADMRQYIRSTLGEQYQVREAENGKEGIILAKEILPDLIISDVMMPEMDGFRLCERIKSHELTSHIPVILLTAKADRQSKLAGLETGADDYLSKPFDAEELQLIVRNRIEERRKMRERFSKNITLEPNQIAITSLDEKFLRKVLDVVDKHMEDENFTIEALSEEVGYSHVHFYRKLKSLTAQTPSQFLRTIRLKRAAELLQQKSDNVSQVAYSVGFSSLPYFNKCFKEQFGMTPGQFAAAGQEAK